LRRTPWWWTLALSYHKHVQNIYEAAALDPEKMVAPKDMWFDAPALEAWFESRQPKED